MTETGLAMGFHCFIRQRPFKPFVVELVNGERILVEHPETLAFNSGAAVYVSRRRAFALFDHEGVADVRDLPASPTTV